jgi:hypothetical protein
MAAARRCVWIRQQQDGRRAGRRPRAPTRAPNASQCGHGRCPYRLPRRARQMPCQARPAALPARHTPSPTAARAHRTPHTVQLRLRRAVVRRLAPPKLCARALEIHAPRSTLCCVRHSQLHLSGAASCSHQRRRGPDARAVSAGALPTPSLARLGNGARCLFLSPALIWAPAVGV